MYALVWMRCYSAFDVFSLFTNVPIDEAVQAIRERLQEDVTLEDRITLSPARVAELLEMCLRSNYFSYKGNFHKQMGKAQRWALQSLQL